MVKSLFNNVVEFREDSTVYLSGVKRPSFLYDKEAGVRLKYGEYDFVYDTYVHYKKAYEDAGFAEMANNLAIIEVKPDQDLVDYLFQSSGRFAEYIKQLEGDHVNGLH